MKKLLIGLLALGSFMALAENVATNLTGIKSSSNTLKFTKFSLTSYKYNNENHEFSLFKTIFGSFADYNNESIRYDWDPRITVSCYIDYLDKKKISSVWSNLIHVDEYDWNHFEITTKKLNNCFEKIIKKDQRNSISSFGLSIQLSDDDFGKDDLIKGYKIPLSKKIIKDVLTRARLFSTDRADNTSYFDGQFVPTQKYFEGTTSYSPEIKQGDFRVSYCIGGKNSSIYTDWEPKYKEVISTCRVGN